MLAFLMILLGALLIATPVSAATTATIVSTQSSISLDTPFDIQTSISGEPNTSYYIKGRIGIISNSLTKGLTNNPNNNSPDDWLTDNDSWSKFPTAITNSSGFWQGSLKIKASSTATTGSNLLIFRIRKVGVTTIYDSISKTISLSSSTQPSPTPSSSQTPTSSPTPAPSLTTSSSSSFTISNIPSQINSDQSFNVSVGLSLPNNPNTNFYLKGAFKKTDGSNYFGLTKVGNSWVKNSSNLTNQYKITTSSSGNWSGNLEVKPDPEDSGFTESGNYLFKVGRYKDSNSSSVAWSNELNIEIAQADGSNDTNNIGGTESIPQSSANPTNSPSVSQSRSIASKTTPTQKASYQIATVAAVNSLSTPPPKVEIKNQKQTNPFLWGGILLVFAGAGCLGYIYFRKR